MMDVRGAIETAREILVFGHVNPDADCIGSLLVMASGLQRIGKRVSLVLPGASVSRKYRFLLDLAGPSDGVQRPDLVIVLDTAMLRRINKPREMLLPDAPICNIDHHLGNERFGRFNWINTAAASCCQMVYLLAQALNVPLDADQATLLYAGLHADTCGFSLACTDETALAIGAELARRGARIGWVCQKLHRSLSISDFRLMQLVYANTRISPCGRFAWSTATQDEMDAIGVKPNDIDEQVAVPRSIDGVKIAALLTETRRGTVRINLRAEDQINILPLAQSLGGGGHAQAAGAVVDGTFSEVVARITALALRYLDDPSSAGDKIQPPVSDARHSISR
jgi:bifunctional oligoribonuclease and PAP phosphatase NrnA